MHNFRYGRCRLWVMNCLANHRAGAAVRVPITDTKADCRRGREGHNRTHAPQQKDGYSITSSTRVLAPPIAHRTDDRAEIATLCGDDVLAPLATHQIKPPLDDAILLQ